MVLELCHRITIIDFTCLIHVNTFFDLLHCGDSFLPANNDGNIDQKHLSIFIIGESIRHYFCKTRPSDLMLVFFSGKRVARMIGEVAEYDLFLSCRVNSDCIIVSRCTR